MKKGFKLAALAGVALSTLGLASCGDEGQTTGTIKIGVLVKNPTTEQNQTFSTVLKDIQDSKQFDVEFVMSESIDNAEKERTVLETWATAGVKGVISCVDELSYEVKGSLLKDLEMYFITYGAPTDDRIEKYGGSSNPYYLGGFGRQKAEVSGAKELAQAMLKDLTGEKAIVVGTAAKNDGTEMFIDRFEGIKQAVDEWAAIPGNSVKDGKIKELPGFGPQLVSQISQALVEKPDVLIAEAGGSFWTGPVTDAKNNDKNYHPILATIDSLATWTNVRDGVVDYLSTTNDDRIALSFAYLYNFCRGNTNVKPNSSEHFGKMVEAITPDLFTINDLARLEELTSKRLYTIDEVKSVVTETNPNATFEDYLNLLHLRNR